VAQLVLGADGGNSKTELVVATTDGDVHAHVVGPGSNSHGLGAEGTADVLDALVAQACPPARPEHGAFFLCGADVASDIAELSAAVERRGWVAHALVDNDTFALLRAGSDGGDAVAVICGAGINCVGRAADGRVARYPSLGWETGDWGGSEMLGRDVLFHAARAEDGRGEPTMLADLVRSHFGAATVLEVGEAIHYRRLRDVRLGELAPAVLELAEAGDAVARRLVERLADEIASFARKAMRDLDLAAADVVLGGGMLAGDRLVDLVTTRLPDRARPVVFTGSPIVGAVLAALDLAGATADAKLRVREELA
jgi:N-acetylglucosamine kinase-like BadF-type ATPase